MRDARRPGLNARPGPRRTQEPLELLHELAVEIGHEGFEGRAALCSAMTTVQAMSGGGGEVLPGEELPGAGRGPHAAQEGPEVGDAPAGAGAVEVEQQVEVEEGEVDGEGERAAGGEGGEQERDQQGEGEVVGEGVVVVPVGVLAGEDREAVEVGSDAATMQNSACAG